MKIRDSIFDSESERELYSSIKSKWSDKVNVFAQVPLCNIIDFTWDEIGQIHRQFFPTIPRNYYLEARPDYTVCDLKGLPLLTIEFDGMYGGMSANSKYCSVYQWDQERELKFNYKLKLATLARYPLLIVSYQEDEPVSPGEKLTILDGIIGSCLASLQVQNRVEERLKEVDSSAYTDEDIQNLLSDTEVELEMEWDPIARLAAEYSYECFKRNIGGYILEPIGYPELPPYRGLFDTEGLRERVKAMKNQTRIGYRVRMKTPNKEIVEEVLLRNFNAIHISPELVAENLARYRACKRALMCIDQ